MGAVLELENILVDVASTYAAVDFDLHEVTQGQTHFLRLFSQFPGRRQDEHLRLSLCQIYCLQCTKREHAGLSSATLTLHYHISLLNDRQNRPLLDCRWLIEAICVKASEQLFTETELVESGHDFNLLRCVNDQLRILRSLHHVVCCIALSC